MVHFTSWKKGSHDLSRSNCVFETITAVSMQLSFLTEWWTKNMVLYPCHWSCLSAPWSVMLSGIGKEHKEFIGKLPTQSWQWTDVLFGTSSTTTMMLVRPHPAVLQLCTICQSHLALQIRIHSYWIPGTQYEISTNRGWINHSCYRKASDPTGGVPNTCHGHQSGWSAFWQSYSSWWFDLRSDAWEAWDWTHWLNHPDWKQLYAWRTAFRDAREQKGLQLWRWLNWSVQWHRHHQRATMYHDSTTKVWSGNQWRQIVWGRGWRWCRCRWGSVSIASW